MITTTRKTQQGNRAVSPKKSRFRKRQCVNYVFENESFASRNDGFVDALKELARPGNGKFCLKSVDSLHIEMKG